MVQCRGLVLCKTCLENCTFYSIQDIDTFLLQPTQGWYYNTEKFREAMNKKEQCKVPLNSNWGLKKDQMTLDKMRKQYHEYCPKSKSNNLVFCPEKIIKRKKEEKVQLINDYFKHFEKVQLINDYFKHFEKKMNKKRIGRKKKFYMTLVKEEKRRSQS